jgi:hypothetical protein
MRYDDILQEDTAERFRLGLPPATLQEQQAVVALTPMSNPRRGHFPSELIWGFRELRERHLLARQQDAAVTARATPLPMRAVPSGPVTVDRAARTVEVVWATGVRCRNFVHALGWITEELEMSPNAVRLDALRSGYAPVLNTHSKGSVRDVLGRVISARIENGYGLATLRFTSAADVEPIWQRVVDGALRGVSAGYRVHRYEQQRDPVSGDIVHRAVDWEPYEISVVPVPIDRQAMTR